MKAERRRSAARPARAERRGSVAADILFFFSAGAFTMAGVFLVTSFGRDDTVGDDPGRALARGFAAALAFSGLFVGLLGIGLLRGARAHADHYVIPVATGIVAGGLASALFLAQAGELLWLPAILVVFALGPVRRLVARKAGLR